jgi:hypothetical protein
MNRCLTALKSPQTAGPAIDVELIAQRILKLAEISMLDHLEALELSQAMGLAKAQRLEKTGGRRMCPSL